MLKMYFFCERVESENILLNIILWFVKYQYKCIVFFDRSQKFCAHNVKQYVLTLYCTVQLKQNHVVMIIKTHNKFMMTWQCINEYYYIISYYIFIKHVSINLTEQTTHFINTNTYVFLTVSPTSVCSFSI